MEPKTSFESDSLIGQDVKVDFWERVNCGLDEESELPRTITGKLIDVLEMSIIVDTERTLYRIRKSKIDSIEPINKPIYYANH